MIHLLLLLALLVGGQGITPMTMPLVQADASSSGDARDMPCNGCLATDAAAGACEMLCIALPAVLPDAVDLAEADSQRGWAWQPSPSHTRAISPDTSPPRA